MLPPPPVECPKEHRRWKVHSLFLDLDHPQLLHSGDESTCPSFEERYYRGPRPTRFEKILASE
jgi:hypothetical protein